MAVLASNMLLFLRQTMACAKEGFPPGLRADIVRETSEGEGCTGCDEGQRKGDEGRQGGRETGATRSPEQSDIATCSADKQVHRDG